MLTGTNFTNARFKETYLGDTIFNDCNTLHLAKGLESIVHEGNSSVDVRTLRACVNYLPNVFLEGVGYEQEEIVNLRVMYKESIEQVGESHQNAEDEHRSITFNLDVPDEFRVPCEQYLMYFVQFLLNFGVEVNTNLNHTSEKVWFTITPTDERQALEQIAEALNIYINMSAASESNLMTVEPDISYAVLKANISTYQGQVALYQAMMLTKEAMIQAKDAKIDAQQTHIDNLKNILSNTLVIAVQNNMSKPQEDKELVLGGMAAITKYNTGKGIEVNLPELWRRAKRLFNKQV